MSEGSTPDAVSPETVSPPAELTPGGEVYCSIPSLGWVRGKIVPAPNSSLPPVQQNGTSYQFLDLSHAPIVSLWAPKSLLSDKPIDSPSLIEQRDVCLARDEIQADTTQTEKRKGRPVTKGKKSIKKSVRMPNKLNQRKSKYVCGVLNLNLCFSIYTFLLRIKSVPSNQISEPTTATEKTSSSPNSSSTRFKFDFYSQSETLHPRTSDITLQYQTFEFPMPKKTLPFTIPSQKLGTNYLL